MKIVQRKPVREEKKPQIPMWVPAWIKREIGLESAEECDWFIWEDDNGKRFAGLNRIKEKEGEEGEEEKGEEDGNH